MTKSCWIFILAFALISTGSERAYAEHFSSKIERDLKPGDLSANNPIQVAQAIPESGDSATYSTSLPNFESRFAKKQYEFGLSLGFGFSINLPPETGVGGQRTEIRAIHFTPNFKYNLTGIMGKSVFRGALYWVVEATAAVSTVDPEKNGLAVDQSPTFMIGLVPVQLEYKFLNPERSWAPFVFAGVGGAWGDFFQGAVEISTAFEFILQAGAGIEYFFDNGTAINFNYRIWHLSNSNVKSPNVGINAHVFSLGYSF
jgi:opacity protein-like surface antigen